MKVRLKQWRFFTRFFSVSRFILFLSITAPAVLANTNLNINIYQMTQGAGQERTAKPFASYQLTVRGQEEPPTEPDFSLKYQKTTSQSSPILPSRPHKLITEVVKSPAVKGNSQCTLAHRLGMVDFSQWDQTDIDRDFHITPMAMPAPPGIQNIS